jgi:polyphenol oxidase
MPSDPTLADTMLRSDALPVRHGFCTRQGGVSQAPFDSLNCSLNSRDDPAAVAENRARVAAAMGVAPDRLLGLTQTHSADVVTIRRGGAVPAWQPGQGPRADALVSNDSRVALGIITADCAPVLFADAAHGVVGAAHAGWRGAATGVLEATVEAMVALGAERAAIAACVGPCIAQAGYEVGPDMRDAVLAEDPKAAAFFVDADRPGHFRFDLSGICVARLGTAGIAARALGVDTLTDVRRFYSHRRRTLAGGGEIGHQISVIRAADQDAS